MDEVKFYFSFRSPYAWLAYERMSRLGTGFPAALRRIPVFPPPDFPNDPAAVPAKLAYIRHDVERLAAAYGLPVHWPEGIDTDWMRPHAAYRYAADTSHGDAFALGVYRARFSSGRDIGSNDVLRAVAADCGLDPEATVRACDDPAAQQAVFTGMMEAMQDGLFGVPFFVWRDQHFWGNDRIEWLLRTLAAAAGRPVSDLRTDPFARPQG